MWNPGSCHNGCFFLEDIVDRHAEQKLNYVVRSALKIVEVLSTNAAEYLWLLPAWWHLQTRLNSCFEMQDAIGSKNIEGSSLVKRCKRITRCKQCHLKPPLALLT